jgi:hypothetical protein
MAKKLTLNDVDKKGPADPVKGGGKSASDGIALTGSQGIRQDQAPERTVGPVSGKESSSYGRDGNFGRGTTGEPAEVHAEREGGNQDGLGDQTLLYGGGYFEREKAGLEDGVSVRETMDADKTEPNYNYDVDPLTGNAPERKVGRSNNYEVSGKRSNKFLIGEM